MSMCNPTIIGQSVPEIFATYTVHSTPTLPPEMTLPGNYGLYFEHIQFRDLMTENFSL